MNEPCVVCGRVPTDIDHIKTRGSGGSDDYANCWSLCRDHHMEKHRIGLVTFVNRYPQAQKELLIRGWTYEYPRRKWTMKRHA
jgi:hypothetical protein